MSSYTDAASSFQNNPTAFASPNATVNDPDPLKTYNTTWSAILAQIQAMTAAGDKPDAIYMYLTIAVNTAQEKYYGDSIGNTATAMNSLTNDVQDIADIKNDIAEFLQNPNGETSQFNPYLVAQDIQQKLQAIASDPNLQGLPIGSQVLSEVQAITSALSNGTITDPSKLDPVNVAINLLVMSQSLTNPNGSNYSDSQTEDTTLSNNMTEISTQFTNTSSILNGELQTETTQLNQVFANDKNEYAHIVDMVTAINNNITQKANT